MEGVQDIYELSPMQHGLLFDSVTGGDSGMYLVQLEYLLRGELRAAEFEQAWRQTVRRHAILRTSFHWEGMRKPLQVAHDEVAFRVSQHDMSGLAADEREQRATAFREEDRRAGVDFEQAPLMRVAILREGGEAVRVLWTFHHILMEGWSASIVLNEVLARYRCLVHGGSLQLPEHPPYRNFVAWLHQQDSGRAEAWWREALSGLQSPTHLGIDLAQPGLRASATDYGERKLQLSAAATSALQSLAQRHELTVNTIFQGAWALLISRYSGDSDVVFGTVVSGRSAPLPGVERMVGLFVNNLPARVRVPPGERLVPWLRQLQAQQVRQREFESSSLVQVKGWSEFPAGMPLFESLLVYENWQGDLAEVDWGGGLELRGVRGHHVGAGHPLTLIVAPGPQTSIALSHDRHRFDAESVGRLLSNLEVLLDGMAADPEARLTDLPLLAAAERERLLLQWNDTQATYPTDMTIHGLFEAQVARTPDAEAVIWQDEALTYGALDRRANRLAHHLRGRGVHREVLVGVCVARSLDLVVSLLAILKAGGTYVPLDPGYPTERLTFMLEDSGATLVVTQAAYADRLQDGCSGATVVILEEAADAVASQVESEAPSAVSSDNLAYVIYTSGSTGRPKGTAIEHRCLVNLLHWARGVYSDVELSGVMLSTSICFDLSTFELFFPLSCGGRVFVAESALDLPNLRRRDEIRLLNSVPSAVSALARAGLIPGSVTTINMAGEMLRADLVDELYAQGVKRVCDLYGPSETTTYSTYTQRAAGRPETVGRPLANTCIYLLDGNLEPAPEGVPGEVCIGGAGVARGYLNRPDLTASSFVPDPFSSRPGARMYRTGDLARHAKDGSLQLLGRMDHQVKVRGFRIEPGEIEVTLRRHPGLSDAVVHAREDISGDVRLVAYIVSSEASGPTQDDLRAHLRASLPEVMVPGIWIRLDELPRTPNGKLDRSRLPAPERHRQGSETGFVEPRTPYETTLATIWRKVLDVDRVGVRDNFFDLGGHSLLLLPVIGEAEKLMGVRLDPGDIVLPTLGQLASLCEERANQPLGAEPEGVVSRVVRDQRVPASSGEMGLGEDTPVMRRRPTPFYFGGLSMPLFGCYHPPASPARDRGFALCPPLGHEYIQLHRAFRKVAVLLSDAGFPVLRFDFHGCGDSKGDHEQWQIKRWVEDVGVSVDELQSRAGVAAVSLVGCRLGATLAALAGSGRGDVDELVLWDPVVDGRDYLEELTAQHDRMESYAHVIPRAGEALLEVLGFGMPAALADDLQEVDLLSVPSPPARRVLVIESHEEVDQEPLREHLSRLGADVTLEHHANPNLWIWIEDFGKTHVPLRLLEAMVAWASEVPR